MSQRQLCGPQNRLLVRKSFQDSLEAQRMRRIRRRLTGGPQRLPAKLWQQQHLYSAQLNRQPACSIGSVEEQTPNSCGKACELKASIAKGNQPHI